MPLGTGAAHSLLMISIGTEEPVSLVHGSLPGLSGIWKLAGPANLSSRFDRPVDGLPVILALVGQAPGIIRVEKHDFL